MGLPVRWRHRHYPASAAGKTTALKEENPLEFCVWTINKICGNDMHGKTALITGAAKRVGRAIARELHAAGACVAVHYRTAAEAAEALVRELNAARPGSACAMAADLRAAEAPERLVEAVIARFGRLDALVNNASTFFATPLGGIDTAAWDELTGSNLKAPLFLTQAAAPYLRAARGAVVNITDVHAERPLAGYPLYCAAKAGLLGLTRALAVELAPAVRVNAVAPGPILWPEGEETHRASPPSAPAPAPAGGFDAEARARIVAHTLLKRTGEAGDIARTVRFLLAEAPYITGQVINVDGGRTAHL